MWVGESVLAVAGVAWLSTIAPTGASTQEIVVRSVIGGLIGLAVAFLLFLAVNLMLAPYKQRNEARALLLAKPKPIPLQNRNELRGAIASIENATIQLVNQQDALDKATVQNSYVVDTDVIARRDEAYVTWDKAMNELRRQYLIAGDKYESVCVDLTGFIWMQVFIKAGQIKYPEGDKPIVIYDILRFVGVLAGRVKDTLRKIEELSGQAPD